MALKNKMELNIHYFKILHPSKHIIPLKNAKFVQIPERKKKQVNIQRYCFFKETKKETQQNLKNYNNSLVFVHLHLLSDNDSLSVKVSKPVAFLAHFL